MKNLKKRLRNLVSGGKEHCPTTYEKIKEIADKAKDDTKNLLNSSFEKIGEGANKIVDKIKDTIDK